MAQQVILGQWGQIQFPHGERPSEYCDLAHLPATEDVHVHDEVTLSPAGRATSVGQRVIRARRYLFKIHRFRIT